MKAHRAWKMVKSAQGWGFCIAAPLLAMTLWFLLCREFIKVLARL